MNKTRQWAMLTAVACLAIMAAGWFLTVKPQRSHAAQLHTQTLSVRSSSEQLRSQVNQLRQQQKDLPAQQKLLSQIATKIPDNPALPTLIRQLSAAADGAGVNLVSLAPGAPTLTTPAGATASAAASPVASIGLSIQVQGTYFNLVQFFSALESLNRAMLVTGFTVAPGGAATPGSATPGSATPAGTLNAQVNASVFESPQVTPASTPATTTTVH
jgi:Tfp pilus assembly protein PilO